MTTCTRPFHEALKHSYAWLALHLLGRMPDGEGGELELRNCPYCRSTLGRKV